MSGSSASHRIATPHFLLGFRDHFQVVSVMGAESEVPSNSDEPAMSGPGRDDDKGGHSEDDFDFRVPKIMEEVKRYIRSIDINAL